jgi:hypothetical protein
MSKLARPIFGIPGYSGFGTMTARGGTPFPSTTKVTSSSRLAERPVTLRFWAFAYTRHSTVPAMTRSLLSIEANCRTSRDRDRQPPGRNPNRRNGLGRYSSHGCDRAEPPPLRHHKTPVTDAIAVTIRPVHRGQTKSTILAGPVNRKDVARL